MLKLRRLFSALRVGPPHFPHFQLLVFLQGKLSQSYKQDLDEVSEAVMLQNENTAEKF